MFLAKCPPKLRTLAKPFAPVTAQMGRGGGEHHEHQLAMFLAKCPPKLRTLAKPFAPVTAQMGRGGGRAS